MLSRDSTRLLRLELAALEVYEADEGAAGMVEHAVPVTGQVPQGHAVAAAQVQHPRREAGVGAGHGVAPGSRGPRPSDDAEQLLLPVAVHPEAVLVLVVRIVNLLHQWKTYLFMRPKSQH